jgi:hypothetical protein
MADTDYSSKSLFNEAGFIIQRLDVLQKRISFICRPNPLMFNNEFNCYNYQVWFSDLSSLLNEVWGKLTDDEQKEIEAHRQIIKKSLKMLPIHKVVRNADNNIQILKVDETQWSLLEDNLDLLEKRIRDAMDKHGLGNPDMEGDMF